MTKLDIRHLIGATVLATLAVSLLALAFAWPAANLEPRDVPIGVAGPDDFVTQVEDRLESAQPGAFEITDYADADEARAAIRDREVYGAIVIGQPPSVLTAPAGSAVIAQALDGVAAAINGVTPPVTEKVVALPVDDPRGTGFAAGALPMVLGALLTGIVAALGFRTVGTRLTALVATALGAALGTAAVLGPWLGILPGSYLAIAAVLLLGLLAGGALVVGLFSLVGRAGIGVAALTLMLVGNPLSGATSAPEMLPSGWSELGQWLPPGALASLLRSVAYFDGAGGMKPAAILGLWVLTGLTCAAIAALRARNPRDRNSTSTPESRLQPA